MTRNVNGIRAVMKKGFLDFLQTEDPDILCLQETKAFHHQMPAPLKSLWYHINRHAGQRPGYAWTAIFSKKAPKEAIQTFAHSETFHEHGRITECRYDGFTIINVYFPNGNPRADGSDMLQYKLTFYNDLVAYIKKRKAEGEHIIVTGDFNICHTRIDIARPDANKKSIGFLPEEREKLSRFLEEAGLVDTFRHFYPEKTDEYTRWSCRAWARPRNVWRRLDCFMVQKELIERVESFNHRQDIMGSDHCPVQIVLKTE